jgi:hypothetical protein
MAATSGVGSSLGVPEDPQAVTSRAMSMTSIVSLSFMEPLL